MFILNNVINLYASQMFCSNCGEGVLDIAKFCTNYGNKLGTGKFCCNLIKIISY